MATANNNEASDYPNPLYRWYVVAILIIAYTVAYIDRTMLTLLVAPIRKTLAVSDLQISLLHGLAFAIFYTGLGIPIGRLADRANRRNIILVGALVWSVMTALCGFARNFTQMFAARVGVGVGEASLSPSAYSMLADYFPPSQLSRALSVYSSAIYIGAGLALIGGGAVIAHVAPLNLGFLGHFEPWQVVFLLIGAPGALVGLLLLTVREPPRRGLSTRFVGAPSFGAVLSHMKTHPGAYAAIVGGFSVSSLMWNGAQAWIPSFFMRTFGWTPAEVGLRFGLTLMVLGTAGIITGGGLAALMTRLGATSANLLIGVVSCLLAAPFGIAGALSHSPSTALAFFAGFVFFGAFPYGVAPAAIQSITPNQMRAQISAIYLLGINLAGIGFGPTVVAFLTDKVFGFDKAVGSSMAVMIAGAAPLSVSLLLLGRRAYTRALLAPLS